MKQVAIKYAENALYNTYIMFFIILMYKGIFINPWHVTHAINQYNEKFKTHPLFSLTNLMQFSFVLTGW